MVSYFFSGQEVSFFFLTLSFIKNSVLNFLFCHTAIFLHIPKFSRRQTLTKQI